MKKSEYIKGIRNLADFLESKEFPESWINSYGGEESYPNPYLSLFVYKKEDFSLFSKLIGGFKKSVTDSFLSFEKEGSSFSMMVHGSRENICERVKIGTKIIPAKEEEIIPAEPEKEEDVYEWKCPESFIGMKEEKEEVGTANV